MSLSRLATEPRSLIRCIPSEHKNGVGERKIAENWPQCLIPGHTSCAWDCLD
ncbi:Hypothetical predicted protein [Podarcis lilfordi]|uniref:Uncharacterized protein n=1 Tax=Podarcis lilfordi TaxID=74358 RepID=A0AA35K0I0_9SAUR|nr:Hypothetical predicted protein [Podarcis lilfordi]